jgi:hypothetical protein
VAANNFDYKKYQMRHANASSNEEKLAINQELKDLYATFSKEEKIAFDKGLDEFLMKEKASLEAQYHAIKNENLN